MTLSNIFYLHEIGGKKNQEDYIWPVAGLATTEDKIFIVCDGVGGSENGEIASKLITEIVAAYLNSFDLEQISIEHINQLLDTARQKMLEYARINGLSKDMATTFSLLTLTDSRAFVAWCGDSRIYHLRNDEIVYKTADHSLVNSLVRKGELTEMEASSHPQKHLILKAVNADNSPIEAEGYWIDDVKQGDFFLLCTDGLLENVSDDDLRFLIPQYLSGKIDLLSSLQQLCKDRTKDNYSMYLLQVSGNGSPAKKKSGWKYSFVALICLLAITAVLGFYYQDIGLARMFSDPPVAPANTSMPTSPATENDSSILNKSLNASKHQDSLRLELKQSYDSLGARSSTEGGFSTPKSDTIAVSQKRLN
jgi:protein phosphatase